MLLRSSLIYLIVLYGFCLSAQKSEKIAAKKIEIGLNITNTLAGFFNSGGQNELLDPYLFSLKFIKNKGVLRTAYNFKIKSSSEFDFNTGFGGQRDARETFVNIRIGWEWRKEISDRFTLYWGGDLIGTFEEEVVDFDNIQGVLKLDERTFGVGGGPIMGIHFFITPAVSLSTEAAIYGTYKSGRTQNDFVPGNPLENRPIRGFELLPMIPNSLYLHFRF